MLLIQKQTDENYYHNWQTIDQMEITDFEILDEQFAYVPDNLECENFPFGIPTIETINGIDTVTVWEPKPIVDLSPGYVENDQDLLMEQYAEDLEELCLYQLGLLPESEENS